MVRNGRLYTLHKFCIQCIPTITHYSRQSHIVYTSHIYTQHTSGDNLNTWQFQCFISCLWVTGNRRKEYKPNSCLTDTNADFKIGYVGTTQQVKNRVNGVENVSILIALSIAGRYWFYIGEILIYPWTQWRRNKDSLNNFKWKWIALK